MRCCGCVALALLLVVVLLVGVAAMGGFVPVVSGFVGTQAPRDLGVRWTVADYQSATKKAHVEQAAPELYCLTCPTIYSGKQAIGETFTDREISAWLSVQNSKYGPIRDVQVKLNGDGTGELSGLLTEPLRVPIYARGSVTRESAKTVGISFDRVELGRLPLPGPAVARVSETAGSLVNYQLGQMGGLEIQELDVESGSLTFRGTLPQAARGSAPGR